MEGTRMEASENRKQNKDVRRRVWKVGRVQLMEDFGVSFSESREAHDDKDLSYRVFRFQISFLKMIFYIKIISGA